MDMLQKLANKYKVTAKMEVEDVVNNMMADKAFIGGIPDMLSAANTAIQVAHIQKKPEMTHFNLLAIAYLKAVKAQDASAAVIAAKDLINAGHGGAFGF